VITLGIVSGGPESDKDEFTNTVRLLLAIIADIRGDIKNGTSFVNIVFDIEGSLNKPEFGGLKYSHFSRKEKGIVVAIGISEQETKFHDSLELAQSYIDKAISKGDEFLQSKGIYFDAEGARKILLAATSRFRSGYIPEGFKGNVDRHPFPSASSPPPHSASAAPAADRPTPDPSSPPEP